MRLPFIGRKLIQLLLTLLAVVTFNFLLFRVLPGDPIRLHARSGRTHARGRPTGSVRCSAWTSRYGPST